MRYGDGRFFGDEEDEPVAIVKRLEIGLLLSRQAPADAIRSGPSGLDAAGPQRDHRVMVHLDVDLAVLVGSARAVQGLEVARPVL